MNKGFGMRLITYRLSSDAVVSMKTLYKMSVLPRTVLIWVVFMAVLWTAFAIGLPP